MNCKSGSRVVEEIFHRGLKVIVSHTPSLVESEAPNVEGDIVVVRAANFSPEGERMAAPKPAQAVVQNYGRVAAALRLARGSPEAQSAAHVDERQSRSYWGARWHVYVKSCGIL